MYFYPADIYYLVLVVPALVVSFIAQMYVNSAFKKYNKVYVRENAKNLTRRILDENELSDISIERVRGELTDHYDPKNNVIRLSDSVYENNTVAAVGVAAHEAGHAVQRKEGYLPIKIRNTIVPVVQFASYAAIPLAMLGLVFGNILLNVGVILFAVTVLFQIVTLPVEFDASKKAVLTLSETLTEEELKGVKKVLTAAALTYVASALVAVMNLLRLVILAKNRRD